MNAQGNAWIKGHIQATSGTLDNVTIEENCNVKGTVYAHRIIGDVVAAKSHPNNTDSLGQSWTTICTISVSNNLGAVATVKIDCPTFSYQVGNGGQRTAEAGWAYIRVLKDGSEFVSKSFYYIFQAFEAGRFQGIYHPSIGSVIDTLEASDTDIHVYEVQAYKVTQYGVTAMSCIDNGTVAQIFRNGSAFS